MKVIPLAVALYPASGHAMCHQYLPSHQPPQWSRCQACDCLQHPSSKLDAHQAISAWNTRLVC